MIETKIDELIAALDRNTAALAANPVAKKGRATAAATESAPPAATLAPAAATAPAAQAPAQSPVAPTDKPDPKVLVKATEAVIKLANEYSREGAVAILSKVRGTPAEVAAGKGRPGVKKCSELNPLDWQTVLDEAEEAIDRAAAAAANQSLV